MQEAQRNALVLALARLERRRTNFPALRLYPGEVVISMRELRKSCTSWRLALLDCVVDDYH